MFYLYNSLKDYLTNSHLIKTKYIKLLILCFYGYSINDFINYNFKKKRLSYIIKNYIPYYRRIKFRGNKINSKGVKLLQNKFLTNIYLTRNKIPTTKIFYLIDKGKIYRIGANFQLEIQEYLTLLPGNYVIKPVDQRWGIGIVFLHVHEEFSKKYTLEIIDQLIQKSHNNPHLIEEQVNNICSLNKLNKNSLNTLRIVTVKYKNEIDVIYACIRFSSGSSKVDNWSSGGYAANIDIKTGISGIGFKKFQNEIEEKSKISSCLKIPYFEESMDLVIKAHSLFDDMKSIGWDVAISEKGPIIIEGNDDWDVILPQKLLNQGIKAKLYE